jgi:hypothetical protein
MPTPTFITRISFGGSPPRRSMSALVTSAKKVEMLFAHLKRILKVDRLQLRGLSDATDEFTLAAAVQNLWFARYRGNYRRALAGGRWYGANTSTSLSSYPSAS